VKTTIVPMLARRELAGMTVTIVDCLGRERPSLGPGNVPGRFEDGGWTCPFCFAGVAATEGQCQNPACFTRPGYPPEHARAAIAESERLERERTQREADRVRRQREAEAASAELMRLAQHTCEDCGGKHVHVEHANPNGRKVFLCKDCARSEARTSGRFKFYGRNRTAEEAALRLMQERAMRGVTWTAEGPGLVVGRKGAFEIRLHCNAAEVLAEKKIAA
jgi:transposase-like protein